MIWREGVWGHWAERPWTQWNPDLECECMSSAFRQSHTYAFNTCVPGMRNSAHCISEKVMEVMLLVMTKVSCLWHHQNNALILLSTPIVVLWTCLFKRILGAKEAWPEAKTFFYPAQCFAGAEESHLTPYIMTPYRRTCKPYFFISPGRYLAGIKKMFVQVRNERLDKWTNEL